MSVQSSTALSPSIPAVFLTRDQDLDLTLFCLQAYARHWLKCPLCFLVPVNSRQARDELLARAPTSLRIEPVTTDPRIVPTYRSLLEAAEKAPWIYFATSDRYPYAAVPAGRLNEIARIIATGGVPDWVASLRISRWKDVSNLGSDTIELGGIIFQIGQLGRGGQWHPHFMRTETLQRVVASGKVNQGLREFAALMIPHLKGKFIMARRAMLKFEESTIRGKHTLNVALRQIRIGWQPRLERVTSATCGYASPVIRERNFFWEHQGMAPTDVLFQPLPKSPFHVVSFGGVGSKMIVRWLGADHSSASYSHSHRRLPPIAVCEGQRVVYVFGDPRHAVMSIFARREGRTHLHNFRRAPSSTSRPDFVKVHAKHLEAEDIHINEKWTLSDFAKQRFDLLRLEEHFDNWYYGDLPYPVLFVRYETFEKSVSVIASHLKISPAAVAFQARQSDLASLTIAERGGLDAIYGDFAVRLDSLPDVFYTMNGHVQSLVGQPISTHI